MPEGRETPPTAPFWPADLPCGLQVGPVCLPCECCVPDTHIRVKENNKPGDIISLITITTPPISIAGENVAGRVIVVGNSLQLTQSLDFEEMEEPLIFVSLLCGPNKNSLALIIEVINVNDNQPEFPEKVLSLNISELYPVGQAWMMVKAIDLDQDLIYYNMDSSTDGANFFRLKTENTPELYLTHRLDFATKPQLTLVLNAKEAENSTSVSDTVNITVCVVDEDNLLPVFLPCTIVLGNGVCLNAVYHGRITQYTLEVGPLSLQPQEICAVDGDTGINATISYQIISGDHSNGFQIDKAKGTLTMRKAATSINPIVLTVLASQVDDPYKYTVTSVTLTVLRVNKHPLNFSNTDFHGVVAKGSPSGSIILCRDFPSLPLIVQAQDGDYPNMTNPRLTYSLTPGHFFSISRDGILLTKTTLSASPSEYNLMVTATDDEHAETASARVTVVVMATDGLSTQRPEVTGPPGTSPSSGTLTSPGAAPGPRPTPPQPGVSGTTAMPEVGPSGPGASLSSVPGTTALTPGKATTTRKPGASPPVSNPAGSLPTHSGASSGSPNSPGPLVSTTGAAPGPRPTSQQPAVSGTTITPGVGPSGPGASPSSVPGGTALTPGKATTTRKPGASPPMSNPAGSLPTHSGASSGSPNSPGPLVSTTGAAPGPRPTSQQPAVSGTTITPGVGPSGPGASPSSVPGGTALTPGKATTTRKPVSNPAGSMTTHPGSSSGSPNSPGPLISTTGAAPGSRPTPPQPTISGTTAMPEVGSSRPGATLSSVPETTAGPSSLSLVYSARHMAAVGVPLSVLLLVCLVIITILVRDVGWKNIKQRSAAKLKVFSRRPGSSGVGSLQFTNKVLLEEGEVKGSLNFLQPPVESSAVGTALALESVLGSGEKSSETMGLAQVGDKPQVVNNEYSMLQDNTSDIEVKSILTKERRNGEGYKAVWFQQDIEQQVMGDTLDEEDAGEGIDGDHNDRSGFSSSL
ncbi:cadherin-related family member 5-like isoform X2 [Narcine bancroftii]|uniref:cadherin-related family member 5-like isoform X2 n=1 Tax=Narcine bancroftii TaxID=1343680 RepID=UPI0038312C45